MRSIWMGMFVIVGIGTTAATEVLADNASLNDALTGLCKKPFCVDYDASNPIYSADGTRIAAKDWAPYNSKKPTFLFVHGYPHGQGVWLAQIPLALKYRLVTMDRRGSGLSGVPEPGNYEDSQYSADIDAVINKLRLKNVILVVHSYGGIDMNAYVKNHSNSLSPVIGVVTVAAVMDLVNITITPTSEALIVGTLTPDPANPSAPSRETTSEFVNASHYQPFPSFLSNAFLEMDMETPLTGRFGQLSSGFAHSDGSAYVARINVPVLVVTGLQDIIVSPPNAQWWQDNLTASPRVQRLNMPNVGHLPQLEAPIQFNYALDAFANGL